MNSETGSVDINGANLVYEVAGTGAPLVFVHGYGLDRRMWDDQFEHFAARHRTRALAVPACRGRSPAEEPLEVPPSCIPFDGPRPPVSAGVRQLLQYLLTAPPPRQNLFPTQIINRDGTLTESFSALADWSARNAPRACCTTSGSDRARGSSH